MAFFFVLLGTFDGVGYHVHEIRELSFIPDYRYGYADAHFTLDATYNPILFPFYWLSCQGRVSENFSMIYLPNSYERSEWGPPIFDRSLEDRFVKYTSFVVTRGILANLAVLLVITALIEISRRRILYVPLFLGVFGFSAAGIVGVVAGSILGIAAVVHLLKREHSLFFTGLRGYIVRRIAYSFILVVAVITMNFIIFMRMPGNPLELFTPPPGRHEDPAAIQQQVRELWGLNLPVISQYFTYLRNLLSFNLGRIGITQIIPNIEHTSTSVVQNLVNKLPYTIFLLGTSTIISLLIGVHLGIIAVQKRGGILDKLSSIFPITISCMPVWWMGFLLLFAFGRPLGVFYGGSYPLDWHADPPIAYTLNTSYSYSALQITINFSLQELLRLIIGYLQYAILPLCTLVLFMFGQWVLLTRASFLQILGDDYLLTARAKGLKDWTVLTKHGLKNACLPLITQAALSFGFVITGSALVEAAFRYPGIGSWLLEATRFNDIPILMAVFYVISLLVIMANIIADMLYVLIDPRIKTR